jgi:hypothetical protein
MKASDSFKDLTFEFCEVAMEQRRITGEAIGVRQIPSD